jgi:hypothetical protein
MDIVMMETKEIVVKDATTQRVMVDGSDGSR